MLLLTVKGKGASFAVVSMIADLESRMRDTDGVCAAPTLPAPKKPSLDRKALKRTLQNCGRDPEV